MLTLYRTPQMVNEVKKRGAIGYFRIRVRTFLALTVKKRRKEIEDEALFVGEYNSMAIQGQIRSMPFIRVTPKGKVIGHEGRHRAFALLSAGEKYIEVALIIADKNPHGSKKTGDAYFSYPKYKVKDVPRVWKSQFSDISKPVNLSSFKKF